LTKQEKTALGAVGTNAFLTVVKFVLAYLSGSLALLAEAFHSFSDIGSSSAVFISVRREIKDGLEGKGEELPWWRKNPQRKVAVGIGVFLMVVAVTMFAKVFSAAPFSVNYPVPVALGMLVLALFSYLLSRLELAVGESTRSTALVADGHHARVDMFGSLLVAGALLGESLSWPVDKPAAAFISFMILLQAFRVFVTVARDIRRSEEASGYLLPDWMSWFSRENFSRARLRLLKRAALFRGLDPEDPESLKRSRSFLLTIISLVVLAAYLLSGVYSLAPTERAVVERFGKPLAGRLSVGPGIHYRLPWPVDRVRKVDATTVRRKVIGSAVAPDTKLLLWTNMHYIEEHNMLTGENIFLDVGMSIHYRIKEPYEFLYSVDRPEKLLESLAYGATLIAVAQEKFYAVITSDRDKLEDKIAETLSARLAPYKTGIEIVDVTLRDLHPPVAVAADFEDVVSATVDYQKYISEAEGYRNDLIPKAEGEAESNVIEARANKESVKIKAEGESERFLSDLAGYRKAPGLFRDRLYLETMERSLRQRDKYILPEKAAGGAVELFLLNEPAPPRKKKGGG